MTDTLDDIWNHREKVRHKIFKGIGEPVIQVPGDVLSICMKDGEPQLFIRMDDLIQLATSILDVKLAH